MTYVGRPNYFEQHLMDEKVFNNYTNKPKIPFLLHMLQAYFLMTHTWCMYLRDLDSINIEFDGTLT